MTDIVPLRDLSRYKVADGDADVRGWDVFDRDGTRVGTVDELLVDPAAEAVRYLAVRLSPELSGADVPGGEPAAAPLTGMAALGALAGQGIAGNPVTAGLPGMVPGVTTAVLGEPAEPPVPESAPILIPVSRVRLDRDGRRVTVDGRAAEIAALPGLGE